MLRPSVFNLALAASFAALAAAPARAADRDLVWAGEPLPTFARAPQAPVRDPADFWKGFSYGVEAMAVGGRGYRGGFGGAANVALERSLDEHLTFAMKATSGYQPGMWKASPWGRAGATGTNFALGETSARYDVGRVSGWVSVGLGFAKPTRNGGFSGGLNAANGLFSDPGKGTSLATFGAGVDYQVTNDLRIGVGVRGLRAQ